MSASAYPPRQDGNARRDGDASIHANPAAHAMGTAATGTAGTSTRSPSAHASAATLGTSPGSAATSTDSVGALLRQITHDVPELVVKELALARAELTESMRATRAGIASMVGGGAVLLSGLVVLLMSAVYGLSNVLQPWLAALLVGAAVVVIGLVMVSAGRKKLEPASFKPERALHQMHKDKAAMTGSKT